MAIKKESFFWTSYSDLMTSLFFVMLVLFVLTVVLLNKKMIEIKRITDATQEWRIEAYFPVNAVLVDYISSSGGSRRS